MDIAQKPCSSDSRSCCPHNGHSATDSRDKCWHYTYSRCTRRSHSRYQSTQTSNLVYNLWLLSHLLSIDQIKWIMTNVQLDTQFSSKELSTATNTMYYLLCIQFSSLKLESGANYDVSERLLLAVHTSWRICANKPNEQLYQCSSNLSEGTYIGYVRIRHSILLFRSIIQWFSYNFKLSVCLEKVYEQ